MNNAYAQDSYFAPLREALPDTLPRLAAGLALRALLPRAGAALRRVAAFFFVVALLRDFFLPVALRVEVFGACFAVSAAGVVDFAGSSVFRLSRNARRAVEDSTDFKPCR